MEQLSRSEEQVMVALWACEQAATRRQIAANLPAECHWADSTLLNFLLRLEKKRFVRTEKQGNKNLYTRLVRLRLMRRGEQCPPANAVRRRPAQDGTCPGRHRPPDLRRHRASAALAGGVPGRKPGVRLRIAARFLIYKVHASPPCRPRSAWARGSSALWRCGVPQSSGRGRTVSTAPASSTRRHRGRVRNAP